MLPPPEPEGRDSCRPVSLRGDKSVAFPFMAPTHVKILEVFAPPEPGGSGSESAPTDCAQKSEPAHAGGYGSVVKCFSKLRP
jgi:hypothetical protein